MNLQIFETDDERTVADCEPNLVFDDPNECADYILRELRRPLSPSVGVCDWVVAIGDGGGLFYPYREKDAIEEDRTFLRITFDDDGNRILEGTS